MTIIAELSAVVEAANLVAKIVRLSLESNFYILKRLHVLKELDFWKNMLEDLEKYARDAETKQSNDQFVWQWLKDLQALCLDIEDVITDLQSMRLEASSSKFMKFCKGHSIKAFLFGHEMKKIFQTIKARSEKMFDDAWKYGLTPRHPSEQGSASQASDQRNRGPLKVEPVLFGREEEKSRIMDQLLSYKHGDPEIGVLAIVGMGGIGKTTIAQHVFNDELVKNFFEARSWIDVSRDYDMSRIMWGLLAGTPRNVSERGVEIQLMEKLKGKKFLIILDDLWNDKKADWDLLMTAFRGGSAGSKIIVTTRSEYVADMARTVECTKLQPVTFEYCWKLFCSKVGVSPDGGLDAIKEEVGKKIVSCCKGLPLAAAIYGDLLRNKEKLQYWETVRDKQSLMPGDGKDYLMSVMKLSYNDLPGNLKRCFALLAVFPKDYEISRDDTYKLWSAEESIEEVERDFIINELVARSLLISRYDGTMYVIHDMVRELACMLAGVNCCVVDDNSIARVEEIFIKEKTRHLHFRGSEDSYATLREYVKDFSVLRTLSLEIINTQSSENSLVKDEVGKNNYFSKLKYLRKLDCNGMSQLQYSHLKNIISLRYLKIENSQISQLTELNIWLAWVELKLCKNHVCLPSIFEKLKKCTILIFNYIGISGLSYSIAQLTNLEMLDIVHCVKLNNLPSNIGNLKKLKYLRLNNTGISDLPDSIAKLENLERLDVNNCKKLNNLPSNIGNLKKLMNLQLNNTGISDLPDSIAQLENLELLDVGNCEKLNNLPSDIGNLKKLKYLRLDNSGISDLPDSFAQLENLEMLGPKNCEKLNNLPDLPGSNAQLKNLEMLGLNNCKKLNNFRQRLRISRN